MIWAISESICLLSELSWEDNCGRSGLMVAPLSSICAMALMTFACSPLSCWIDGDDRTSVIRAIAAFLKFERCGQACP